MYAYFYEQKNLSERFHHLAYSVYQVSFSELK